MKLAQRRQKDLICAHFPPAPHPLSYYLLCLNPIDVPFFLNRSSSLFEPNNSQGTLSCSEHLIYDNCFLDGNLHSILIHCSSLQAFTVILLFLITMFGGVICFVFNVRIDYCFMLLDELIEYYYLFMP